MLAYKLIGGFEHNHPNEMNMSECIEAALHHVRMINFFDSNGACSKLNNDILSKIQDRIKFLKSQKK